MSRPREKNNRVNPVTIYRIKRFCFDNLVLFYYRHLENKVDFDRSRFLFMMREDRCTEAEEIDLYMRLSQLEEELKANVYYYEFVDQGQSSWAAEARQRAPHVL